MIAVHPRRSAPKRRMVATVIAVLMALAAVAGCSDDQPTSGGNEPIVVTIEGGEVTPRGDRIQVVEGSPVTLEVTSDTAGELHVHTDEEQSFAFEAGATDIELTIDQPGLVDVELHDPDLLVLQLEVR